MLLVVQLQMTKQPEEEQRTTDWKVVYKMSKNIVSAEGGWMGKRVWGGSGVSVCSWSRGRWDGGWEETAATTAETYQNSSYILAQSLGLPED